MKLYSDSFIFIARCRGGISFFMGHRVFKLFVMVLWYAGQYLIVQAFALCWIGLL